MTPSRRPWILAALCGAGVVSAPAGATPPPIVPRVLIYWMAYDNNLSVLADPIVEMLGEAQAGDQVVVTVHMDRQGPGGMARVVLEDGERRTTQLPYQEGSAELGVLASELAWVRGHHPAERYAVIFLDHGGRLGEMSNDGHGGSTWLDPRHVAETLTRWDAETPGELDVVFLQQCGKASVETLHALAPAADWIVASEAVIGAPNFYYPAVLAALVAQPTLDGEALARAMVSHDRADMYRTYTVARSSGLLALPAHLDPVLAPLLALGSELRWTGGPEPVFTIDGERYLDLLSLLTLLYADNGLDPTALADFRAWWTDAVIAHHQISPDHPRDGRRLSGASVLLPAEPGGWRAYADFPLYQQTRLAELMDQLLR